MTDQPEKRTDTEETTEDFEGHKVKAPEKNKDISEALNAADDDADFEGHSFAGVEKNHKLHKKQ